jgi:L-cystine uptake protein TcyP (sodium:dicarboxylate symporter family)
MNISIEEYRLVLDFGMVVLIWMVQLLIYPSFKYFEKDGLNQWHSKYTRNISFVVMPLMTIQMILAIFQLYRNSTSYSIISLIFIVVLWLITFAYFVPLHQKITKGLATQRNLQLLVRVNWIRTILWTALFFLSLINGAS